MATPIDTRHMKARRNLHFTCLDDIRADVEQLAQGREIKALGNWTPGQIFQHLAHVMNRSIDGFGHGFPAPARFLLRLLFKRRFLTKPMTAGFQLPKKAAADLVPPPIGLDEGLQSIHQALHRLQTEARRSPNPVLGALSREEWEQLHCRHSELHLSFLLPVP
jgi:hypothetical protein